jgi:hypothetical protein
MAQTLGTPQYTSSSASGFDRALKELYAPAMNDSPINKKRVLLSRIQRDGSRRSLVGRRFLEPINMRGSQGLGARGATGSTPTSGNQTIIEALIPPTYNYGVVVFNLPTIFASRNDAGAFARVMDVEMGGMRRDGQNEINRQLHGNNLGSLGMASAAGTSTDILLLDAGHSVKAGMIIDMYENSSGDPSSTSEFTSVTVSSITGSTTVTLATSETWADNAHVVRAGNRANEITGIKAAIDATGTYMGINRATYAEWASAEIAAAGAEISDAIVMQTILSAEEQGEGDVDVCITDYTQFRKYGNSLVGDRRYGTSMTLPSGFVGLEVANAVLLADRDCVAQTLYAIDMSTLTYLEMSDGWEWDDTDGSILHKQQGGITYEGVLVNYGELYNRDPRASALVTGLAA